MSFPVFWAAPATDLVNQPAAAAASLRAKEALGEELPESEALAADITIMAHGRILGYGATIEEAWAMTGAAAPRSGRLKRIRRRRPNE